MVVWRTGSPTANTQLPPPPPGSLSSQGSCLSVPRGSVPPAARAPPDEGNEEYGGGAAPPAPNNNQAPPRAPPNRESRYSRLRAKASIRLATHNVNGYAHSGNNGGPTGPKWTDIHATVRNRHIAVLALQETHLSDAHLATVETLYSCRLKVFSSNLPSNPGTSAGVAFVLNKDIINTTDCKMTVLIPGRAIALRISWYGAASITLLNVYAPNPESEHEPFWTLLASRWQQHRLPHPDFMMGDFNLVEDAIDRAPAHTDGNTATEAFLTFRSDLNLQDSWRHAYPDTKTYTIRRHNQDGTSLSRLDRIYTQPRHAEALFEWEHDPTSSYSDHALVCVRFAPLDAPFTGKGRWTLPLHLLDDPRLLDLAIAEGARLSTRLAATLTHPRTAESNPQRDWTAAKNCLATTLRQYAKSASGKIQTQITKLTADAAQLKALPDFAENEGAHTSEHLLSEEIKHLEQKHNKTAQNMSKARWQTQGEKPTKYWFKLNSERTARDMINCLRIPDSDPPTYETFSKRMAALAGRYHDELQDQGRDPDGPIAAAVTNTRNVVDAIPDAQRLPVDHHSTLENPLTEDDVLAALKSSNNGTATGLDGLPYELWKALHEHHAQEMKAPDGRPTFNIIAALTAVYNDIQCHGLVPGSEFSQGWMCPIYKKKDRTDIANYRPITLLNTDYKIFTKLLACRLANDIPRLIHPNQAGFIPGRSIFDQTRLAKTMITYAEAIEENGVIIALDQEKAYDKVDHDYLWKVLKRYRLPDAFIATVRSLYEAAHTQVAINGFFSPAYRVMRGVRQGDPLSCLIFDLAIEPLACMLRQSPLLTGFHIPGLQEKILVSLFADDTALYLSANDRYDDVKLILDSWCAASGAKFNIEKTEIVPIGTPAHRQQVITTRKINPLDTAPMQAGIRIADEGDPVRYLGAILGNGLDDATPWSIMLDKLKITLARWSASHPTLRARAIVVQAIVGGTSLYLARVQGMPAQVEKAIIRLIRDFIWDGKDHPPLSMAYLYLPPEEGGIGLLDIQSRNEALHLVWLRAYLDLSPSRPTWAFVTDVLINNVAPPGTHDLTKMNLFLQTWTVPLQGPRSKLLSRDICAMLRMARKHNVSFAALKLTKALQKQMPAWHHLSAAPICFGERACCLRDNHCITSVAHLLRARKRLLPSPTTPRHTNNKRCHCAACRRDRAAGCENPNKCTKAARRILANLDCKYDPRAQPPDDGLTLTHHRHALNAQARASGGRILFDPTVSCKSTLAECFRVFTDPAADVDAPADRLSFLQEGANIQEEAITFYTDGSCINNGKANARCGAGVWVATDHPYNKSVRVPGPLQSNQVGEIAAVLVALQTAPNFAPVLIKTDSRYVIDGLTQHLPDWEDRRWIGVRNAPFFTAAAYHLRRRTASTEFQWIKGHSGDPGNDAADAAARLGAEKPAPDLLDLSVPTSFRLQGAKLMTLTLHTAYQGVRLTATAPDRAGTNLNVEIAQAALEHYTGQAEMPATLWRGCYHKDLRNEVCQFLFRSVHNLYCVGLFWLKIPACVARAICASCAGETDSMGHILAECSHPTTRLIWTLAHDLWPHGDALWPTIDFGTLMSVGALQITTPPAVDLIDWPPTQPAAPPPPPRVPTKADQGKSRLLRILLSEAAHLIWVLRCDRLMTIGRTHPPAETTRRWIKKIGDRLSTERYIACRIKCTQSAKQQLRHTWTPILHQPPDNWQNNPEVLVGVKPPRSLPVS